MINTKLTGWFLVLLGIGLIFWSLYSNFVIFTGRKPAPEIFELGAANIIKQEPSDKTTPNNSDDPNGILGLIGKSLGMPTQQGTENQMQGLETGIQETIEQTLPSIPKNAVVQILNLFSWSMFSGIVMFGAGKIAGIGIKLVKND